MYLIHLYSFYYIMMIFLIICIIIIFRSALESFPMFIWSLFVGSFLDNYTGATNILLLLNILGNSFTLIIYLINMYFYESSKYNISINQLIIILNNIVTIHYKSLITSHHISQVHTIC